MKVIGLGKKGIVEGKLYDLSEASANVLIAKGLVYKEGEEKPTPKRKRKPRKNSSNTQWN